MEVYVEKEKVIKKVGSELDTLKEILDWLERYVDGHKYDGKMVDYSEEPVMSVKARIAGSESVMDVFGGRYDDLMRDYHRWSKWLDYRVYRECCG